MPDENKPYTTRPTSQLDLERRLKEEAEGTTKVDPNAVNHPYAVEGNDTSAYRGVDADRMTYASDTEKPLDGDGVEDEVAQKLLDTNYAYSEPVVKEGKQTLGTGSTNPSVFVVTSGENVTHEVVDRKAVLDAQAAADKEGKVASLPEELSATKDEPVGTTSTEPAPNTEDKPKTQPAGASAPTGPAKK